MDRVQAFQRFTILERRGPAVRIRIVDREGWVEAGALTVLPEIQKVKPQRRDAEIPLDFRKAKNEKRTADYHRNRREPIPGEMIFLRESFQVGDRFLFRFFSLTDDMIYVVNPELSPLKLLTLAWKDFFQIPRYGLPVATVMMSVFPLPDGTPDPGWVSHG